MQHLFIGEGITMNLTLAIAEAIPAVNKVAQAAHNIYQELNQEYHLARKAGGPEIEMHFDKAKEAARSAEMAVVLLSLMRSMYNVAATKDGVEAKGRRAEDYQRIQNAVNTARLSTQQYREMPNE